jgi:anti-sigma regulatory factor (Ser/Thr protein kinase)
MPFTNEEIEDIRLALGEAAVNAVCHGANPKWPKVGVELWRNGSKLRVAVWDRGRGFDPRTPCRTPECLAAGGRGIMFMKSLMDDVRFRFTRPGTRVEMTKTASAGRSCDSRRHA